MLLARAVVAVVLLAVSCAPGGGGGGIQVAAGPGNVVAVPVAERTAAPVVEGERLTEGPPRVEPGELDGVVAVVNFWGSWCGPCREEQPRLEALWRRYESRGVRFVGIDTRRDQRAAALAFLDEFDVTYPSIYDPDSALAFAFGVRFMPATYVIDAEGRIAAYVIGALQDEDDMARILDAELA
ncbi:MAG TPA: TlpA disulfide reductase family protein [Actinomycetota bacterium]